MNSLTSNKYQIKLLLILIIIYLLSTAIYMLIPGGGIDMTAAYSDEALPDISPILLTLANLLLVAIIYFPVGYIGISINKRTDLPGIINSQSNPKNLYFYPLLTGIGLGLILIIVDIATKFISNNSGLTHPSFPSSIFASLNAGIGEEIFFRLFLMSMWVWILTWVNTKMFPKKDYRTQILIISNILAALGFSAGHFPTVFALFDTTSLAEIPPVIIGEVIILNMLVGLAAGNAFRKHGLIAASGIHFWTDIVWHVIYGLFI